MNTHDAEPPEPNPSDPDAMLLRTRQRRQPVPSAERVDFETWMRKSRRFQVEAMFDEVREEDLADPANLLRLGRRQLEMMFTAWAIDTLRLYREVRPTCVEGAVELADAMAKDPMTRPDAAEAALRTALEMDPRSTLCHVHLGHILSEAGRTKEAIDCYERAFDLGCDDEDAWFGAANAMLIDDQPERALRLLDRVEPDVEDRAMLVELRAECRRRVERRGRSEG